MSHSRCVSSARTLALHLSRLHRGKPGNYPRSLACLSQHPLARDWSFQAAVSAILRAPQLGLGAPDRTLASCKKPPTFARSGTYQRLWLDAERHALRRRLAAALLATEKLDGHPARVLQAAAADQSLLRIIEAREGEWSVSCAGRVNNRPVAVGFDLHALFGANTHRSRRTAICGRVESLYEQDLRRGHGGVVIPAVRRIPAH